MAPSDPCPPVLAEVTRDGVVESVHRGHVVVCGADGTVLAALGEPGRDTYVRSSAKPFQAIASLEAIDAAGVELPPEGLAIACASHTGTDQHQIEAAHLLALAGLDETALGCPPAMPDDTAAALALPTTTQLAHNCSGKHGGFLLAQAVAGRDPAAYLDVASSLQTAVRDHLARVCGAAPSGFGIDGCGAPAWRLPLSGLATGFARLAEGAEAPLARIRDAMTSHPELVGGLGLPDTELMRADGRVVAKRGAEAVFGAGLRTARGAVGIAVKVEDGGNRAAGPVAAAVLAALGVAVPEAVRTPTVLGGGQPHGALRPVDAVSAVGAHVASG